LSESRPSNVILPMPGKYSRLPMKGVLMLKILSMAVMWWLEEKEEADQPDAG
jgi:hypothetical protein